MSKNIKRFVDNHGEQYDDFVLSLNAGYVDQDGDVCNQQKGIEDTFSIGMPVYGKETRQMLGRLRVGLFKNLHYSERTKEGEDIPVECWQVDGYKGDGEGIITYHQLHQDISLNKEFQNE